MKLLKDYDISLFGLKEGVSHFEYKIENQFFEAFNYDEFFNTNVLVNLELVKKSTLLELHFSASGTVNVACDVSNEAYDQNVIGKLNIVVKFGNEFNDDNEEILIIPYGEHQINVAQYIYEMIILAVPKKRIHPGIEDGSLQSPILEKLKELQPSENKNLNEIDPRWEDLKKLLTDNNI
ncbi:MAG: DUF177 domain-containing protein [Flavobacteriaceae bacterium]|nr:DUF177 domain-containing protein [Flavobacteriaceae bacterium]